MCIRKIYISVFFLFSALATDLYASELIKCKGSPLEVDSKNDTSKELRKSWTNCSAKVTYSDGRKYVGEWKDGNISGQGNYTYADGRNYVGEWKDNMPHGQGTMTYTDGGSYFGGWKDGRYHGQGTAKLKDGSFSSGEWRNGDLSGYGHFFNKGIGTLYSGVWIDGKGKNVITYKTNDKHVYLSCSINKTDFQEYEKRLKYVGFNILLQDYKNPISGKERIGRVLVHPLNVNKNLLGVTYDKGRLISYEEKFECGKECVKKANINRGYNKPLDSCMTKDGREKTREKLIRNANEMRDKADLIANPRERKMYKDLYDSMSSEIRNNFSEQDCLKMVKERENSFYTKYSDATQPIKVDLGTHVGSELIEINRETLKFKASEMIKRANGMITVEYQCKIKSDVEYAIFANESSFFSEQNSNIQKQQKQKKYQKEQEEQRNKNKL